MIFAQAETMAERLLAERGGYMKKIRKWLCGCMALAGVAAGSLSAQAAFNPDVESAYNLAVQGQDALDGLDVTVVEETVSSMTNISTSKTTKILASGIRNTSFAADLVVEADEKDQSSYYRNGYYYEETAKGPVRRSMSREEIWKMVNAQIYLDMTSNYLKMLYAVSQPDGGTTYVIAANEETLGDYKEKLLDEFSEENGLRIDSIQGSMDVDKDGHVTRRTIQMIYTAGSDESSEVFLTNISAEFSQNGSVAVSAPDLSGYKELSEEKAAVTLRELNRTAYVTADVNVRSAGSLDGAVIGGYAAGSAIAQLGVTSDGWAQIQYNQSVGYIWNEFVVAEKPVTTSNTSGVMYATVPLNVRDTWSSDGQLLGTLAKGESIEITGKTSNGWTRVNYKGNRAYVYSDYLSWSEPVVVQSGSVSGTVTDASYGSLTILSDGGYTVMFNTVYASINLKDTLETGDYVTVAYTGTGSPYTAKSVTDHTSHASAQSLQYYSIGGVVLSYSGDRMQLSCSDGVVRSFDLSQASQETDAGIFEGAYLCVTWQAYSGSATKGLTAIAVS